MSPKRASPKKILRTQGSCIKLLATAKPTIRKVLLDKANPDLIEFISDCALNVLKGNVKLDRAAFVKLRRHKRKLLALVNARTKHKKKIVQKGGGFFLPALLAPLIGGVLSTFLK